MESQPVELKDGDIIRLGEDYNLNGHIHLAIVMRVCIPESVPPISANGEPASDIDPSPYQMQSISDSATEAELRASIDNEFQTVWASIALNVDNPIQRIRDFCFSNSVATPTYPTAESGRLARDENSVPYQRADDVRAALASSIQDLVAMPSPSNGNDDDASQTPAPAAMKRTRSRSQSTSSVIALSASSTVSQSIKPQNTTLPLSGSSSNSSSVSRNSAANALSASPGKRSAVPPSAVTAKPQSKPATAKSSSSQEANSVQKPDTFSGRQKYEINARDFRTIFTLIRY